MKDDKYIRVRINLWDRKKMVQYLEKQAHDGWLFCGFDKKGWRFRPIEPQAVHFTVSYFAGFREDDFDAGQRLVEFREYCAHDGWLLAGAYEEVQVFYNLNKEPIPIHTDPHIEVETMHTIALRKLKPQFLRFAAFTACLLAFALYAYHSDPVRFFLHAPLFLAMLAYGGSFLVYLLRVAEEFLWLYQAKRYAATHEEYPHDLKHLRISTFVGAMIAVALFGTLLWHLGAARMLFMCAVVAVLVTMVYLIVRWIDRLPLSQRKSEVIGAVAIVVVLFLMLSVFGIIQRVTGMEGDLYVPLGSTWAKYEETPPLDIEAYYGDDLENLFYSSFVEESPFLAKYSARMYADRGEDWLELSYDILEVKWDALYDLCVEEYLMPHGMGSLAAIDAAAWGAEEVYCRGADPGHANLWLLCYENRIVVLVVNEDPTPEQMALVGKILGNEQKFENNENK